MSDSSYSVTVQERIINASLNSSVLQTLLMGVYTMVYGSTMHLYMSRNKSNTRVVVSMITLLYALSIIDFAIQWYWLNQCIVVNGATRLTTFLTIIEGVAPSLYVIDSVVFYSSFVVSDALLIWRCYHVWGMSLRIIAVPSAIFLGEVALLVTTFVLSIFANSPVLYNANLVTQYNNVVSAYIIISLSTTIVTTFLIGYRIHTTVTWMTGSRSKHRFNHVMTMILESAAIYAVTLVALAITSVIPSLTYVATPGNASTYFIEPVAGIAAGMAPTVLVARIALKGNDTEMSVVNTTQHISDLKFGSTRSPGEKADHDVEAMIVSTESSNTLSTKNQHEVEKHGSGLMESDAEKV